MKSAQQKGASGGLSTSQQLNQLGQGQEQTGVAGEQSALTNPTSTPLYNAMLNTSRSALSNAYQGAASNAAQRANAAGFGYQQPISQAEQTQLGSQEASQAAQLPMEAIEQSTPIELQGYGQMAQQGLGEQGIGADYYKSSMPYLNPQSPWQQWGQPALRGALAAV